VTLRRRLARKRPDAHLPALVENLNTLGTILYAMDRPRDGAAAWKEADELLAQLTTRYPDALLPDLEAARRAAGVVKGEAERTPAGVGA
jgi:hypothetical protein